MSTVSPADEFRATMRALQSGKLSAEEARSRNAALRARIGDNAYDVAKRSALVAIARGRYDSIEVVAQLAELLEEHGPALGAYYANQPGYWADNMDSLGDGFEEDYRGEFGSEEEFAQQLADDISPVVRGSEAEQILSGWPYSYIDWEAATRDLFMGDYWSVRTPSYNVWVFATS